MTSTGIASAGYVRKRRKRRSRVSSSEFRIAAAAGIALCGAAAAAFASDAAPTGTGWADACYRAAMVAIVSLLSSRARRWAWLIAAAIVTALGAGDLTVMLGVVALALAAFGSVGARRDRLLGAAVGSLVGLASLDLVDGGTRGVSALAAVVACSLLVLSGSRNLRTSPRRVGIALLLLGGAFLAVSSVAGAFALLEARSTLDAGAQEARTGLEAFRDGDDRRASTELTASAEHFSAAAASTSTGAGWLGALVPVLGSHLHAITELSTDTAALAGTIAGTAGVLEAEGVTRNGRVDLARVAELEPQAEAIAAGLDEVSATIDDIRSPWLIAPLQEAIDELDDEIDASLPQIVNVRDALQVAPDFLGAEGVRLYLVVVGNPAEARELGGFAGSFGLLSATDGNLEFDQISTRSVVRALAAADAQPIPDLPQSLASGQPSVFPQNWTAWPDYDVVSDLSAELMEDALGFPIDGVLYVDPYSLAALLEFTGPVRVDGVPYPITPENAAGFLMREQYAFFVEEDGERKELIGDVAEQAFDELTDGALPEPRLLAQRLGPLVAQRRLLFRPTQSDRPIEFLDRIGLTGVAPRRIDEPVPQLIDELVVAHNNLRSNKLDAYLTRRITYELSVDPVSEVASVTVRVEVTNNTPSGQLPDVVVGDGDENADGLALRTADIDLALHSSMDTTSVTVDGTDVGVSAARVGSRWRHATRVTIPRGETAVVVYRLERPVDADGPLTVRFLPNGGAVPDLFAATVSVGDRAERVPEQLLDRVTDASLNGP